MSYPAIAVANAFLELASEKNESLDPMKLLKLIYFAHGWYLVIYDEPLLNEWIEAWEYGPVIPVIYYEFRKFGSRGITRKAYEIIFDGRNFKLETPDISNSNTKEFLSFIYDTYGKYNGIILSNMTHEKDAPWFKTRSEGKTKIDNEKIKEYFIGFRKSLEEV